MRPTPFSHIVELLNAAKARDDEDDAPGDVGADDEDEDQDKRKKTKKKAKPEIDEEDNGDERREDGDGEDSARSAAQTAALILAAGAMRRGEIPVPVRTPPPPRQAPLTSSEVTTMAAAILGGGTEGKVADMSGNGHDNAVAEVLGAERAHQERRFAEVVRAIALANDPQWRLEHAHIIEAVRRRGDQ